MHTPLFGLLLGGGLLLLAQSYLSQVAIRVGDESGQGKAWQVAVSQTRLDTT